MSRRLVAALLLTTTSACSSAAPVAAEPEQIAEIDRCAVIATGTIEIIDEYLAALETLPPSAIVAGDTPVLVDLAERSRALEERTAELGCDMAEIRDRVADHLEDAAASTTAAVEFLRELRDAYDASG